MTSSQTNPAQAALDEALSRFEDLAPGRWIPVPDEGWSVEPFTPGNPGVVSLHGRWRFALAPRDAARGWRSLRDATRWAWNGATQRLEPLAQDRPTGLDQAFHKLDTDDNAEPWCDLNAPGNWEREGFSTPVFSRAVLDRDDVVGYYRRWVEIDADWTGDRVILQAEGIATSAEVWVNGREIGYHDGGFVPFQMDLTEHVRFGEANLLAIRVVKADVSTAHDSSGQWMLSGIYRDAFVFRCPCTRFADTTFVGDYDPATGEAMLRFAACFDGLGASEERDVRVELSVFPWDGDEPVAATTFEIDHSRGEVEAALALPGVAPWHPERPALYRVEAALRVDGVALHTAREEVGFRRWEVDGPRLLLNGKRIVLRGVVRHEIKLNRGRALTLGDLREEIRLMRRAGIDAVRSHPYPFDPRFFKLCARAGIAVMTELYLCGYDSWGTPWVMSETPTVPRPESEIEPGYLALLRERHHAAATAIHARYKSLTALFAWSLSNESGICDTLLPVARFLGSRRLGRIVVACGELNAHRWGGRTPLPYADAFRERFLDADTWHYPEDVPVESLGDHVAPVANRAAPAPVLYTESAHVFCNREHFQLDPTWGGEPWGRALARSFAALSAREETAGFFVFEWSDQGMMQAGEPAVLPQFLRPWSGYADFHQNLKGVLRSNHDPKPAYAYLQATFGRIRAARCAAADSAGDSGRLVVELTNLHAERDLSAFRFVVRLLRRDEPVGPWRVVAASCPPGGATDLELAVAEGDPGDADALELLATDRATGEEAGRWSWPVGEARWPGRIDAARVAELAAVDPEAGVFALRSHDGGTGFVFELDPLRLGTPPAQWRQRDLGMGHLDPSETGGFVHDGMKLKTTRETKGEPGGFRIEASYEADAFAFDVAVTLASDGEGGVRLEQRITYRGELARPLGLGVRLRLRSGFEALSWLRDGACPSLPRGHPDAAQGRAAMGTDRAAMNPFAYPTAGERRVIRRVRRAALHGESATLVLAAEQPRLRLTATEVRGGGTALALGYDRLSYPPLQEFSFVRPAAPRVAESFLDLTPLTPDKPLTQSWTLRLASRRIDAP